LNAIGSNRHDQIELWLGLLEQGAKVWESGKLSKRWQEALSTYPSSTELWTKYIDYYQTNFLQYRYEQAKEHYCKCLRVLSSVAKQSASGTSDHSQLEIARLYLTTRFTAMMSEAGYAEHAIAVWQCLFEYTFFRPAKASALSRSDKMTLLEEFWETEVPRIGESDALGWSNYNAGTPSVPKSAGAALSRNMSRIKPFASFYEIEEAHRTLNQYPGRTSDDDGDDPYHVVLFSDISACLSELLHDYAHDSLLEAFLNFFGLPMLSSSGERRSFQMDDTFLGVNRTIRQSPLAVEISGREPNSAGNSFSEHLKQTSRNIPSRIQMTERELFEDAFHVKLNQQSIDFVRELLSQIVSVSGDERIAEYFLAFLSHYFPNEYSFSKATEDILSLTFLLE
jgi:hypothetical protein